MFRSYQTKTRFSAIALILIFLAVIITAVFPGRVALADLTHDDNCPFTVSISPNPSVVKAWTETTRFTIIATRKPAFNSYCGADDRIDISLFVLDNQQLLAKKSLGFPASSPSKSNPDSQSTTFDLVASTKITGFDPKKTQYSFLARWTGQHQVGAGTPTTYPNNDDARTVLTLDPNGPAPEPTVPTRITLGEPVILPTSTSTKYTYPVAFKKEAGDADLDDYTVECDKAHPGISGPKLVAKEATEIVCDYPKDAATYTMVVGAIDANKKPIGGPVEKTVTITGTEYTDSTGSTGPKSCGASLGCYISQLFAWIISLITTLIYWTFAYVVSPMIEAVLGIKTYSDQFVQVIYSGWLILRNLSNIFFIIVLLIIGLATVFQIEKYNYKHLLVQVIIAAVMVNFSLIIGQSVLGIAETVQNQFLPDKSNVIRALGYELMVKPVEQIQHQKATGDASSTFANLTLPFFLLWLCIAAFFTFLAVLAFLVVRLVALWILLMVSPLAYVANVLPETQKYFKEWWNKFLANAFVVVILGFFLNLAAVFANSHVFGQGSPVFNTSGSSLSDGVTNFVFLTASHFTVIFFLWAGLKVAGSSGAAGAKAITSFAEKGINQGFKYASGGALAKYMGKEAALTANEGRLKLASKMKANPEDSKGKAFFKRLGQRGVAPDMYYGAKRKRINDRRESVKGLAGANAADLESSRWLGTVKTNKAEQFRLSEAKKRAADETLNPKNAFEAANNLAQGLNNNDMAKVLGTIMVSAPNGTMKDAIKYLADNKSVPGVTAGGNVGLSQFLGALDKMGITEAEKQAIGASIVEGSKKTGSDAFGAKVLSDQDKDGKTEFLNATELKEEQDEAQRKTSNVVMAREGKKGLYYADEDSKTLTDNVKERMVDSYNTQDDEVNQGLASETVLNNFNSSNREILRYALRENRSKTIAELAAFVKSQNAAGKAYTNPGDEEAFAKRIAEGLSNAFDTAKVRFISTGGTAGAGNTGATGTTTPGGGGTTTTVNNVIYNTVEVKINSNLDVKNSIASAAPEAAASLSPAELNEIEKLIKDTMKKTIRTINPNHPSDLKTPAFMSELSDVIRAEIRNVSHKSGNYGRLETELGKGNGYKDLANHLMGQVN